VANYRDESFVLQFLSRKVVKDLGLFILEDDSSSEDFTITDIQDYAGLYNIRTTLSDQLSYVNSIPDIEVSKLDIHTRELYLMYNPKNNRKLDIKNRQAVKSSIESLWGFPVILEDPN
jgi:spore cortex formation protein SpoVR/YcgB (stage V sporulation)